jgi:carbon monoxide dehydrogenase subunit G
MRLIKLAILSFIFLFLLITAISLFIPSHIRIAKTINLQAPKDSVMMQLKDPAKWKNWYPGMDTVKLYYENGVVKGVVVNDKDSARPMYLHITEEDPDEIAAEFVGGKLKPVMNTWKAMQYPTGDSTALQWNMDFHLRWYPWEKFSSLIFEGSYGQRMARGLLNIRRLVEPESQN